MLRKFPRFKGKNRLARLLYAKRIERSRNEIISGKYGLSYKLPNLKETVAFSIFVHGIYEPSNIEFIISQLPPNAVFVDLGANIGSICIPVAKLRPDIKVIAVEASPRVFSYLKFNVENNNIGNITVVNNALADIDNQTVSFYSPEEKFGKGSMSAVFTQQAEMIDTIKLDTLLAKHGIDSVDFIKIDVEGYESIVFKGADSLLSKHKSPQILFEFAHWAERQAANSSIGDSQKFLLSKGYSLFQIDNPPEMIPVKEVFFDGTHMLLARKSN